MVDSISGTCCSQGFSSRIPKKANWEEMPRTKCGVVIVRSGCMAGTE